MCGTWIVLLIILFKLFTPLEVLGIIIFALAIDLILEIL